MYKRQATLGLRHGPDSYGRQQWGILRNGGNPDAATPVSYTHLPGSISLPRGGPASYARLTIENGRATLLELVDEDGSLLRKESL